MTKATAWCLCATLTAAGFAVAEDARPSADRDLPPPARQAIRAGVEFLATVQGEDGSWLSDGQTGRYPVAMTSLAGLALLANGSSCYAGPHASHVRAAVEYLLRHADPDTGLIGSRAAGRPMFGHGFAMLFLAQVYGSEGQTALARRIRHVLESAIALTARSQSARGGWYYSPDSDEDEGAVTITQVQGLRACANAGLAVPAQTVQGGLDYVRKSVNEDGGISYRAGTPGDSRAGITCAALATMLSAGLYDDPMLDGALAFALANTSTSAPSRAGGTHFYYSHLYLSQALYFRGGPGWADYFAGIRSWLISAQNDDGSWDGDYIGRVYGTSVALLVLQLPHNNMPMLQP